MKIIYDTKTGHSKEIALKLDPKAIDVVELKELNEKAILVTHTEGKGITPENTIKFLEKYHEQVVAFVVTGNFIKHPFEFGKAGYDMGAKYNKPMIRLIQQLGNDEDIKFVQEYIANLANFDIK